MKKNPLDIFIFISIFFILIIFLLEIINLSAIFFSSHNNQSDNSESANLNLESNLTENELVASSDLLTQNQENPQTSYATISVIGDIMCHNTQFKDAYTTDGTYNFLPFFDYIKDYISTSDIAIGNLETTFAGSKKGYSGYPNFNTPEELAYNLKDIGFDILTTANNHSLDTGYQGLVNTINVLNDANILHTGTATSQEEKNKILIQEVNGIKFAFLAYTYGTNGNPIPKGKDYCINLIDQDFILSQIEQAKNENCDIICASMHWGEEYNSVPSQEQLDLTDFLFQNGVDIILGSHPHVLQKMEKRNITLSDGTSKDCFVIYSLGNFMSGQNDENTRNSIILNLTISKSNTGTQISNISYIPIYTYTYPNYKNYKILDLQKSIFDYENGIDTSMPKVNYLVLKSELEKINNLMK